MGGITSRSHHSEEFKEFSEMEGGLELLSQLPEKVLKTREDENYAIASVRLKDIRRFLEDNNSKTDSLSVFENNVQNPQNNDSELKAFFFVTINNLQELILSVDIAKSSPKEKEEVAMRIDNQLKTLNDLTEKYRETRAVLDSNVSDEKKLDQLNQYGEATIKYEKETRKNFPASILGKKIAIGLLMGAGLLLGAVLGAAVGLVVGAVPGLIGHLPGVIAGGAIGAALGAIKGAGIGAQVALGAVAIIFGVAATEGLYKTHQMEHPDKKVQREFLDKAPHFKKDPKAINVRANELDKRLNEILGQGSTPKKST